MGVGEAVLVVAETLGFVASVADLFTPETVIEQNTILSTGGGIWYGTGEYSWTDASGNVTTETLTCAFGGGNLYDGKPVASSSFVNLTLVQKGASGAIPSVSVSTSGSVTFSGGGFYGFVLSWAGDNSASPSSVRVTDGGSAGSSYKQGAGGGKGSWGGTASGIIARNASHSYSTDKNVVNNGGRYIPPGQYTFDGLRAQLIDYYNVTYDIDISVDDPNIPDWEDFFGEDATEPPATGDGFQFDYNEVINPSELDDILKQETYELDEIETGLPEFTDVELPSETMDEGTLQVLPAIATQSYELLTATGLANVFIPLAVILCVIKILRGE